MTWRVGIYGVLNAVVGGAVFAAFLAFDAFAVWAIARGDALGWTIVMLAFGLLIAAGMLLHTLRSINARRPVRLVRDGRGHGTLILPAFGVRGGFGEDRVDVGDIRTIELAYRPESRNGRWHLQVHRRDSSLLSCDSITSYHAAGTDVSGTAAYRAVEEIRAEIARIGRG